MKTVVFILAGALILGIAAPLTPFSSQNDYGKGHGVHWTKDVSGRANWGKG